MNRNRFSLMAAILLFTNISFSAISRQYGDLVHYRQSNFKIANYDRFLQAVNKVRSPLEQAKEYLFLNVQHKKIKIWFSEILYIESQGEYFKIVTAKTSYLTKMGMQEIEALLPERLFMRVHRSFIVALNKIESYTTEFLEIGGAFQSLN